LGGERTWHPSLPSWNSFSETPGLLSQFNLGGTRKSLVAVILGWGLASGSPGGTCCRAQGEGRDPREAHTAHPGSPELPSLLCRHLGQGEGPQGPALPPSVPASLLVLPLREVPSCFRPAGAELKLVTRASLALGLWLPLTYPQSLPTGASKPREERQVNVLLPPGELPCLLRAPAQSSPALWELEALISRGWCVIPTILLFRSPTS
jgi:hypothetical protein